MVIVMWVMPHTHISEKCSGERCGCTVGVREGFLEEVTVYLFFCIFFVTAHSVPCMALGTGNKALKTG